MNPAFHRALPVKTFGRVMLDLFALIDQENDHVPITIRMQNFTLDALGFAAFGKTFLSRIKLHCMLINMDIYIGFDFQSLKGDPEEWTKTYNIVFASLANLFFNLIPPFLIKYISPKTVRATERFYKMLENLVDTRREEIRRGEKSHIPDNEKDLLTLMIEADMEAGTQVTSVELRVSFL
jgi:cytochrome P450